LLWFSVLATAYATERASFKLLVDRAGPFRLFSAEVIAIVHCSVVGVGIIGRSLQRKHFELKPLGVSLIDVGLISILDTLHLLLVVITGAYVAPTLTVILVQATMPLMAFFSQFVHPRAACNSMCIHTQEEAFSTDRFEMGFSRNWNLGTPCKGRDGVSMSHMCGAIIMLFAVGLGLIPTFVSLHEPNMYFCQDIIPVRRAYNTILFVLSCIPAAASQLYKEHTLLRYKQPIDTSYLNLVLSLLQCTIVVVLSPLVYVLQGLGAGTEWVHLYRSMNVNLNFLDGMKCFLGLLNPSEAELAYPEEAQCQWSLLIVLAHVMSIVIVNVAVDKIVHAGATKVMYRGTSGGIILGVFTMYVYEYCDPFLNYGSIINTLHLTCTFLLILGSEAYHQVSLNEATFETTYPELHDLYEDHQ